MRTFKNIYYDSWKNKMYLWEYDSDTDRTEMKEFDHEIEYYVLDKSGKSPIKSIYGDPVIRRVTKSKDKLKELKESGTKLFMSDFDEKIKFLHKRYGDQEDKIDFDKYVIANIDIEIQTEGVFPKPEEALFPINLITVQFMRTGETFTFGLKKYTGDKVQNYYYCENESKLIEVFCKLLKHKKTDIITGWNVSTSNGFDIPYIVNRIDRLGLDCSLSPFNKTIRKHNGDIDIVGISVIDMMEAYKKFTYQNHPSFSLNSIAMFELGEKKNDIEGQIQDSNSIEWNSFVEYNLQDVLLVHKIEKKKRLLELIISLCTQTRTPFEDAFSTIAVVEGYLLRNLLKENIVIGDRKEIFNDDTISGGYVNAIPGIYNRLISYDGESLYPTAIRQFNISPETKRLSYEEGLIKSTIDGIFYTKEEGILPKIVTNIFKERKQLKNIASEAEIEGDMEKFQYYDSQQLVKKILINCFHPDTDIMTCSGIKNIKDINVGDEVYSINPITKDLERKKVTFTIKKQYNDELISIDSARCKLKVTKDHNMLRTINKNKNFEIIPAEKFIEYGYTYVPHHNKENRIIRKYIFLNEWIDNIQDYYFILKTDEDTRITRNKLNELNLSHIKIDVDIGSTSRKMFKYIDNTLTTDEINLLEDNGYKVYVRHRRDVKTNHQRLRMLISDFSKLIGWYLSEGSLYENKFKEYENSVRGMTKKITISQYENINPKYYDEIDLLLNEICDTHSRSNKYLSFCSDLMYDLIMKNFGSKFEKRIFKTELGELLDFDLLHDAMYKGDGNKARYRYTITHHNRQFLEDYLLLELRLGYIPRYTSDCNCYRINRRDVTYFTASEHYKKIPYNGDVYCITVEDNHTLLAGDSKHGSFMWTGNCMYGVLCNKYFHFYDLDNASVVTSTGREIIQYVAKNIDNYLINEFPKIAINHYPNFVNKITKKPKVVIIDTDSVAGSSLINTDSGDIKIEDIFDNYSYNKQEKSQDNFIASVDNLKTLSFNKDIKKSEYKDIKYIKKHKVKKSLFKVKHMNDEVIVTEDHSIIIERNGKYLDISVKDLIKGDKIIKSSLIHSNDFEIEDLGIQEEWVYDIEVDNNHNFFANNILVHNSNYINLEEIFISCNSGEDFLHFALNFETIILNPFLKNILDEFAEKYNTKNIMNFKREKIISKLYVQCKKKYICKILANEKKIYKDEEVLKITGIEINKSDLCSFSKKSLMELCEIMLKGEKPNKEEMLKHIRKSFEEFKSQKITDISTPKGVKDYDKYKIELDQTMKNFKPHTPIHNRASIIYNQTIKDNNLPYMEIFNGTKMKFIHVKENNKYKSNIIGFIGNYPKEFESIFTIDYEEQFNTQYLNIAQRFFDTLGFGQVTLKDSKLLRLIEEE